MGAWQDLYDSMMTDMATGSWRTQSYSISGRTRTFTTLAEFREFLQFVKTEAELEAGNVHGRTYARPRT